MAKKIDRRKLRTKKMIKQAVLELIEEKGFKHVTVSDITSRADINRGTFYLHYRDVGDLMENYEEELLEEIRDRAKYVDLSAFATYKNKPYPVIVSLLDFIAENKDLLRVLLGANGNPAFVQKWRQFVSDQISEKMTVTQPDSGKMDVPREYIAVFVSSIHIGIIQYWLESDIDRTPEEIASILTKIAVQGPLATISSRE
ncbi:DNA-binding transcriptional regulator, AcrR family [Evansella caseinilytica]|uniref:DNA-binding transcriptional regulator, AcrR family n=1 Tax=Evansella caseinilytica TaxID=1503961 RepID=A0A1H3LT44_9BACI|nr:TetR/AcrR family transcriptional regulator [Evansella caseinilytica]SDY67602.1 DNA-binding transcriptional regulator, AcrR family [Evansella caseinilytica]